MTNEAVRRKIQAAIGDNDELLTMVKKKETKMIWPRFKVFWFSKDNPTGHSERTKKKRQTEEEVGRQYQEWTGIDSASSTRAAENRTRWKGIVANTSLVP